MSDYGSTSTESMTNGARDKLDDVSKQARSAVGRGYEQAREKVSQAYDVASNNLREAEGFLRQRVTQHPMTSAATAVGVGLIVGMLLSGRR